MMRGHGEFEKPSIDQLGKFHDMVRQEQLHHDLFQFFLEDPWRILEAVLLPSSRVCDLPSLDSAMISRNLKLDDHLRVEDIPWEPGQNGGFAFLKVQTIESRWSVRAIKARLEASQLLPGTLFDLFRLAEWNQVFSWTVPVVALGTPIAREDMGRTQTYYPTLVCRTLTVITAEGFEAEAGREKKFCLGRVKV